MPTLNVVTNGEALNVHKRRHGSRIVALLARSRRPRAARHACISHREECCTPYTPPSLPTHSAGQRCGQLRHPQGARRSFLLPQALRSCRAVRSAGWSGLRRNSGGLCAKAAQRN